MQKFLQILFISAILFCGEIAFAGETQTTQSVEVEKSGAIVAIQKQPVTSTTVQSIKVSRCGLCIIVNVNGKIKDETTKE